MVDRLGISLLGLKEGDGDSVENERDDADEDEKEDSVT